MSLNKERKRFLWTHIHNLFKNSGCHLYQNPCSHSSCQHCPCHELLSPSCCSVLSCFSAERRNLNQKAPKSQHLLRRRESPLKRRIRGDLEHCIVDLRSPTSFSRRAMVASLAPEKFAMATS